MNIRDFKETYLDMIESTIKQSVTAMQEELKKMNLDNLVVRSSDEKIGRLEITMDYSIRNSLNWSLKFHYMKSDGTFNKKGEFVNPLEPLENQFKPY